MRARALAAARKEPREIRLPDGRVVVVQATIYDPVGDFEERDEQ